MRGQDWKCQSVHSTLPKKPQTNQKHPTQTNLSHELISQNEKKKKNKPQSAMQFVFSLEKKIEGSTLVFDGFLLSKSYSRQQLALMHLGVFSATLSSLLSLSTF